MLLLESIGASLLLLAYLGQGRWWFVVDAPFLLLNIVGAGLLAVVAWAEWQPGFAVLNSVWCLVAVRSSIALLGERS